MARLLLLLLLWMGSITKSLSQCGFPISTFPYSEGFEASSGGWVSGGAGNDWAWGTPAKPVISAAGGGMKCWITGGLTATSYTSAEASWLQSPCFDFSTLQHPYIELKVFWETEQQFDGGSFQYSLDNGTNWLPVGSATDPVDCLDTNWFNFSPIVYLSSLGPSRDGWSGNIQNLGGSCKGGNGSNGWKVARHVMPYLAGKSNVIFRFVFGAGTICNNYDGFAVDDILIGEAPPNNASFTYSCTGLTQTSFLNSSALCPSVFAWDFDDPASGTNNTSSAANPTHIFSAPGTYIVTLTVNGPGNAPSTVAQTFTIIAVSANMLTAADCLNNLGGSVMATVTGSSGPFEYLWNTSPAQTGPAAVNLGAGLYTVMVTGAGICPATATAEVITDLSCIGIYFPSAFTPDNDGKNDGFGPLGSLNLLKNYRLSIYNRWGQPVFSSMNPFEKWKGMVKALRTDGGVFVWYAEFILPGRGKEYRKGVITLIR